MYFIFSTPVLIRHLWQLKTVVFLHGCLYVAFYLPITLALGSIVRCLCFDRSIKCPIGLATPASPRNQCCHGFIIGLFWSSSCAQSADGDASFRRKPFGRKTSFRRSRAWHDVVASRPTERPSVRWLCHCCVDETSVSQTTVWRRRKCLSAKCFSTNRRGTRCHFISSFLRKNSLSQRLLKGQSMNLWIPPWHPHWGQGMLTHREEGSVQLTSSLRQVVLRKW